MPHVSENAIEENQRLKEALGRIASNGFGHPARPLDPKRDAEMLAMMGYASETLAELRRRD